MPKVAQVTYFEDTAKWKQNTAAVVEIVGRELKASRIKHVVFATCTGYTGAQFAPLAKAQPKVSFVGVKMAPAIDAMYDVKWNARHAKAMDAAGAKWFGGTHALTGGVDRALTKTFDGGFPPSAIIAMACDAGLLPEGVKVISCAGTGSGADTVIVATSAASANLFDMRIHRVLAMPLA